jgi:single-stranded DNA-binding protein
VYVEGRLQVREYEDKDGNARTSVEVVASKVRFLGRGNNHAEEKRPVPGQPKARKEQPSAPTDEFNQSGDDVPF